MASNIVESIGNIPPLRPDPGASGRLSALRLDAEMKRSMSSGECDCSICRNLSCPPEMGSSCSRSRHTPMTLPLLAHGRVPSQWPHGKIGGVGNTMSISFSQGTQQHIRDQLQHQHQHQLQLQHQHQHQHQLQLRHQHQHQLQHQHQHQHQHGRTVSPLQGTSSGIPVSRYRAKLEECAGLHRQLKEVSTELTVTQEHLFSVKAERDDFVSEIERLRDVLIVTTAELQSMQERVDGLQRENKQLRSELRAQQVAEMCAKRRMDLCTALKSSPYGIDVNKHTNTFGIVTDPAVYGKKCGRRLTHSAAAIRLDSDSVRSQRLGQTNIMSKATSALSMYACECFRTEVLPHMELLHSLFDGSRLVAVDPPVSYGQLSALKRILIEATGTIPMDHKDGEIAMRLQTLRSNSISSSSCKPFLWVDNISMLSFRCDDWHLNMMIVLYIIRELQSLRHVEIISINDTDPMQQLTEALLMALHVEVLSLPDLCLADDGLAVLFSFMNRRVQLSIKDEENKTAKTSSRAGYTGQETGNSYADDEETNFNTNKGERGNGGGGTQRNAAPSSNVNAAEPSFTLDCLDLSRCTITHPTILFRTFRGPTLEVLILTGCSGLRDAHVRNILETCPVLHTLDLSGCEGLTTLCVMYISRHEQLRVLRLENCPSVKQLELENIEVLFSSLAYVSKLYAPNLRRLPIPITHSNVLFDFYAPQLTEISFKGITVDNGTLAAFMSNVNSGCTVESIWTRPISTLSVNTPPTDKTSPNLRHKGEEEDSDRGDENKKANTDAADGSDEGRESENKRQAKISETTDKGREESSAPNGALQLLSVGFIDCLIASPSEIDAFMKEQTQLVRLSLHGCKGVVDSNLARLPSTLLELDVGGVAQLTGSTIQTIVLRAPQLIKLNLKNAGTCIQNKDLFMLQGLGSLEVLNLLQLPQLLPEVITTVAKTLPQLRLLYHETAVIETTKPMNVIRVERKDEEDTTREDIHHCAKELLQLRNETALALWMEAQLPKPSQFLPSRYEPIHEIDIGAPQPPLTVNTTFYEIAQQTLSRQGRNTLLLEAEASSVGENGENASPQEHEKPDVLTLFGNDDELVPPPSAGNTETDNNNNNNNKDDDDEEEKSRTSLYDARCETEAAMDEKGRLAVEKTPLGPWDGDDIVNEHRRQSWN